MGKRKRTWLQRLFILLLGLLIIFVLIQLKPVFTFIFTVFMKLFLPLALAALVAYLLHPFVEVIETYVSSRTIAVIITFTILFFCACFIVMIGYPSIITQVEQAFVQLPPKLKQLELLSNRFQAQLDALPRPIRSHTVEWLHGFEKASDEAVDYVEKMAISAFRSFFSLFLIPVFVFYFLKDFSLIKKAAWYLAPRKWRKPLQRYMLDVDQTFGNFIRGQLVVALIVSILAMIGFSLIRVPYPVLLGLFIGFADLVPYFGAIIGAIPAIVVALLESWQLAIFTCIIIIIIQQIEGNVLSPFIVGKSLQLHLMLLMIALLIGMELGGVIGLLLAVPLLAILKVTLLHIRFYRMDH